jgi:acyl carrier protein
MALERQKVCAELIDWVAEASLEPDAAGILDESTDLIETGVIDSFGMLDLLTWIEERYGVFIEFGEDDEVLTQIVQLASRVVAEQQRSAPAVATNPASQV